MNTALIGLDPLFLVNVKLFIKDVLDLERTEEHNIDAYKFHNHYIKFAEICGIIVAVETNSRRAIYTVDDGTATIPCGYWIEDYTFQPLKVGTSVRVLGKITTHRETRELSIYDIYEASDPNQELLHMCQVIAHKREYEKEFLLPKRIELCQKELEHQFYQENRQKFMPSTQVQEEEEVEQEGDVQFEEALLEFLESIKAQTFSNTVARDDTALIEMAVRLLQEHESIEEPSKKEISDYFGKGFNSLLKNGYIIESNKQKNLYKVVDDSEFRELVIGIIKDTTEKIDDFHGGVRLEYITCKIAESEYSTCKARVKRTINDLIEECYLYPVTDKDYKLVL